MIFANFDRRKGKVETSAQNTPGFRFKALAVFLSYYQEALDRKLMGGRENLKKV